MSQPHRPSPSPDPETTSQTPPDRPSPRPPGAERSAASSTASPAADGGLPWLADPGPAFDPETGPAAPELDIDDQAVEEIRWEESQIRDALTLQGEILHSVVEWRFGLEDTDVWMHTQKDLRAIAPPLTRILNRYDVTRAAAAAGDEALLAAAVIRYGSRNVIRTRRAMARRRPADEPRPVTGRDAEPETGPEFDEEYQHTHGDPWVDRPPSLTPKGARR